MLKGRRIAVVVPAFNEDRKIAHTLRSIPGFVDHVIVVDDASQDATGRLARRSQRRGLEVLSHEHNLGVGAAIATGYAAAFAAGADITVVMAGDRQMDPADLSALTEPVLLGRADYAKGNRFAWPGVYHVMPPSRAFGNVVLSYLTRLASGYGHVFDSQCGYTAANRRALGIILSGPVFPRYGYQRLALPPGRARRARRRRAGAPGVRPRLAFGHSRIARGGTAPAPDLARNRRAPLARDPVPRASHQVRRLG
jgi:glycosyltransferase involved in cell wall biosynthesis